MHEKERIDYLAHISKAIVEFSPLERPDKDQVKNNIDFAAETNLTGISFSLTVEGLFKTEKSISISCDVEDVNLYKDKKAEFAF